MTRRSRPRRSPGRPPGSAPRGAPGWRSRAPHHRSRRAARSGSRPRSTSTSLPPITSAAAVSSQLVSMPSTTRGVIGRHVTGDVTRRARLRPPSSRSRRRVVLGPDVVAPHHDRVLGVLVVPLAHPGRGEPEPAVQLLRAGARHPHLQRQRHAAALDRDSWRATRAGATRRHDAGGRRRPRCW